MLEGKFCRIDSRAILPTREADAVGYDIYTLEDVEVKSREVMRIRTGLVAIPPDGYHWEIYLRSSTPGKFGGLFMPHGAGIIDPSYCGPEDELLVQVLTQITSWNKIVIPAKTKFAQLILRTNNLVEVVEVMRSSLPINSRGGFGSSNDR